MRSNYRLLIDYINFLKEEGKYNDYNSRLIFIRKYIGSDDFILYGVENKEQLNLILDKFYAETH